MPDYSLHYYLLQYQFDRWLFKTITGAVNSSKVAGCSPNRSLENKPFWQHQHLYLLDAVRQYGFPSFFVTVSPFLWTFPFPPFMQELRQRHGKDVTDIPALETLHVAHVLEQIARGFLMGGSNNRWKSHIFGNAFSAGQKNVRAYFYRFEFQQCGTLHLHMLVWVDDITVTRADLLHVTVPWQNAEDAFMVADIQKSDKSCLSVNNHPDSFIIDPLGNTTLQFLYTQDDADCHIRAYITTLLGSLRCRTDVQLADGKALLLKYVSSYVTKMHESATSEGLYCTDVTGYQAANSFLRTVTPLELEMIFTLSNIKVCWTDKMTLLFRPPFPGQTDNNRVYNMYLERPASEEDQSLLQWLRSHRTSGVKAKPYNEDKVLVGVKFVSVFNPVYFYQYLNMHHAHRRPYQLRHPEEATMPSAIQYFSQAAALQPDHWSTSAAVTERFSRDGHKDYFVNTQVSYVTLLYDILQLWTCRVIDGSVGDVSSVSIEHMYPLSPLQRAIMTDVTAALAARLQPEEDHQHSSTDMAEIPRAPRQTGYWEIPGTDPRH